MSLDEGCRRSNSTAMMCPCVCLCVCVCVGVSRVVGRFFILHSLLLGGAIPSLSFPEWVEVEGAFLRTVPECITRIYHLSTSCDFQLSQGHRE